MPLQSGNLQTKKYYFTDTSFNNLMKRRIYHVLLVSSTYDAFILEEDGRIDEQLFNEYVSLNLRYPPQFFQVNSEEKAFKLLSEETIDLVITMLSVEGKDAFDLVEKIKLKYPGKPIVVLTPFSREVSLKLSQEKLGFIDYIFCWLGNADILMAIIKLIEDRMNVEHDTKEVGVQTIILVEDSVRFYSSYLPNIYKIIFNQSKEFMVEALNEHQQMLRMRGRPKILLATNYEEAVSLYEKYRNNLLGIISDVSYKRNGELDKHAGIKLVERIRNEDKFMPILLQSSDIENEKIALELGVGFLNKRSKTLSIELRNFIIDYFSFGDFVFIDPKTEQEINRAPDLKSLQEKIFEVPDDTFEYHITRNHFSKWLNARALFPIADLFKYLTTEDFNNLDEIRRFIFDAIANYRLNKGRGIIAEFNRERFDEYVLFSRIGNGSIGGKARGLAFLDSLIKRNRLIDKFSNVIVTIPRTVVLCTDVFDEFIEENDLHKIGLSDLPDEEILKHFVSARLPFRIHEDLYTFISVINGPIAIRSSSLLEDSHYQPFAGIYSTYMIPNTSPDERILLEQLSIAIKSVYASAFFKDSKAYMAATSNVIDEEKMGVVIQEVCGKRYGDRFYPALSGVARSINFYPIAPEKSEDGIASIAFGLGKYVVEGGLCLRFSPKYPRKVLQLSTPEMALKETQRSFYALDLHPESFRADVDDGINILKLRINDADDDNSLRFAASTFDFENYILRDGVDHKGKRLVTFSNILNHNVVPVPQIIQAALEIGEKEMNKPVEIEFAVNLDKPRGETVVFNLLQIRPIVDSKETVNLKLDELPEEQTIIYSRAALGNGIIQGIQDIIYVKPDTFSAAENPRIAAMVENLNSEFLKEHRNYVLVGPGRWGSNDPWLGIPVKWPQISAARIIVESGLENYRIDPSQGTHFFQNLTSFRVGYFTINPYIRDGFYDLDYLAGFRAVFENEHLRHVRFEKPLEIKIDGKKNIGVVMKL